MKIPCSSTRHCIRISSEIHHRQTSQTNFNHTHSGRREDRQPGGRSCFHTRWRSINNKRLALRVMRLDAISDREMFEDKCLSGLKTDRSCLSGLRDAVVKPLWYEMARNVYTNALSLSVLIGWRRCASEPRCTPWRFSANWTCMLARQIEELNIHTVPTLLHKGEFNYAWLPGSNP